MTQKNHELIAFIEKLGAMDYPYELDQIRDDFSALLPQVSKTEYDQDFVDYCIECIELAIRRLTRAIELEAPQFFSESEFFWLKKRTERLAAALEGKDWELTEKEQADLDFIIEISELSRPDADDEDESLSK